MKNAMSAVVGALLPMAFGVSAMGVTRYVSVSGLHQSPFTNWYTAATNLQAAVSVSAAGDDVAISNGTYREQSEIVVSNAISIRSVNGAAATVVDGGAAHRCFYLITNAILDGLTLTNGFTAGSGGGVTIQRGGVLRRCIITACSAAAGGGVDFGSVTGMLDRCEVRGNTASANGGGVYCPFLGVVLRNCLITDNSAQSGGGVFLWDGGRAESCTVARNTASSAGGGVYCHLGGEVLNSIVISNNAPSSPNWHTNAAVSFQYTCTTPAIGGTGNITNSPRFAGAGDYHLLIGSPCINTGTNLAWMTGATDLDDGPRIRGGTVDLGAYEARLIYYVSTNGAHTMPFDTWARAATNIQAAVNAAFDGETVLVSNGGYRVFAQVIITNGITVESVNGPEVTLVWGGYPIITNRCFYISDAGAVLDGFSISNGNPGWVGGGAVAGGGILLQTGTVQNCVVKNCRSDGYGGGVFVYWAGTVSNCVFSRNQAFEGGGAFIWNDGLLKSCILASNDAVDGGGFFFYLGGTARDCLVQGNEAGTGGGSFLYYGGRILNCTVVRNHATSHGGGIDFNIDAASPALVENTIFFFNTASISGSNYYLNANTSQCDFCCTAPRINMGHILTEDPMFVNPDGGDFHLSAASPCLNAGTNGDWTLSATDLEGYPRIVQTNVDMGCYERTPLHYVSLSGANGWPYLTWPAAATSIQAAADAAAGDDVVLVSNGTYDAASQIVVTKGITVRGVNGWRETVVDAHGSGRCFYLGHSGAVLDGLTIQHGSNISGGGIYSLVGGTVQNCLIVSNSTPASVDGDGGGILFGAGGEVLGCRIAHNAAYLVGGGV